MVGRQIASLYLRARGWRFETEIPKEKKYVICAYPHTSNWDGINLLMSARSVGLAIQWMVKQSLVDGPAGSLLIRLGAVPIDRSKTNNLVDQMIREFESRDQLALVVPPEGTRGKCDYWKSGFYHIARGANVPVVPGYMDFERRAAGLGEPINLTGRVSEDMDRIREFYRAVAPVGCYPDQAGRIRLRGEESEESEEKPDTAGEAATRAPSPTVSLK